MVLCGNATLQRTYTLFYLLLVSVVRVGCSNAKNRLYVLREYQPLRWASGSFTDSALYHNPFWTFNCNTTLFRCVPCETRTQSATVELFLYLSHISFGENLRGNPTPHTSSPHPCVASLNAQHIFPPEWYRLYAARTKEEKPHHVEDVIRWRADNLIIIFHLPSQTRCSTPRTHSACTGKQSRRRRKGVVVRCDWSYAFIHMQWAHRLASCS